MLNQTKQVEESLKRYQKRRQTSTFDGVSDEDKIRMQCALDVEAFGEELKKLGCDLSNADTYIELCALTKAE
jgi:Domain of unknown function (DUF3510)